MRNSKRNKIKPNQSKQKTGKRQEQTSCPEDAQVADTHGKMLIGSR